MWTWMFDLLVQVAALLKDKGAYLTLGHSRCIAKDARNISISNPAQVFFL